MVWLHVALGGAFGALARYGLAVAVGQAMGSAFPWGTLLINLSGSFTLAFLAHLLLASAVSPAWRLGLTTGFLGAYTTFSTFAWEALELVREQRLAQAAAYVTASVLGGLLAAWLGLAVARLMAGGQT